MHVASSAPALVAAKAAPDTPIPASEFRSTPHWQSNAFEGRSPCDFPCVLDVGETDMSLVETSPSRSRSFTRE